MISRAVKWCLFIGIGLESCTKELNWLRPLYTVPQRLQQRWPQVLDYMVCVNVLGIKLAITMNGSRAHFLLSTESQREYTYNRQLMVCSHWSRLMKNGLYRCGGVHTAETDINTAFY